MNMTDWLNDAYQLSRSWLGEVLFRSFETKHMPKLAQSQIFVLPSSLYYYPHTFLHGRQRQKSKHELKHSSGHENNVNVLRRRSSSRFKRKCCSEWQSGSSTVTSASTTEPNTPHMDEFVGGFICADTAPLWIHTDLTYPSPSSYAPLKKCRTPIHNVASSKGSNELLMQLELCYDMVSEVVALFEVCEDIVASECKAEYLGIKFSLQLLTTEVEDEYSPADLDPKTRIRNACLSLCRMYVFFYQNYYTDLQILGLADYLNMSCARLVAFLSRHSLVTDNEREYVQWDLLVERTLPTMAEKWDILCVS